MGPSLTFEQLIFRSPVSADASALNLLVANSPPLDSNSVYCNLLQCTHFASTSVAAIYNQTLVGFASGYCPPGMPNTLFIWQIVVADAFRGSGMAKNMLYWLLKRPSCNAITSLATTITPNNSASWALFDSFAREFNAVAEMSLMFQRDKHFAGQHEDEYLVTISPDTCFQKSQNLVPSVVNAE